MPYEIKIENEGTKITTRYYGMLTVTELRESYNDRFTDADKFNKYKLLISDYTDVTSTDIGKKHVEFYADMYKRASSFNPNVIAVVIMPTDLLYGLGRMWEGHAYGIQWVKKVVRTREEADEFIREHDHGTIVLKCGQYDSALQRL